VKFISENSAKVIEDLLKIGVEFDKTDKNKLNFTIEAAHSIPRVLHAGGDCTGTVIESKLCELIGTCNNITIYEETLAVELLCDQSGECKGVLTYNSDTDSYEAIYSNATVLATGGVGQVYKYTTNPGVATGDGLALAIRADAKIRDMEFIQFHPSALDAPCCDGGKMSLISEAVRGEGAVVVDETGECFVGKCDERGSLAPRDVLSRAIYMHMQQNEGIKIYLDISKIGSEKFKMRFPGITKICEDGGVDLEQMLIPIAPSAHYCMGGISTQVNGTTSVKGLYAIGEVGCTGLHGANRLASNSLLECVVSAYELAELLAKSDLEVPEMIDEAVKTTIDAYSSDIDCDVEVDTKALISQIKNVMWDNAGI
jgi:L-aspartate oxidase